MNGTVKDAAPLSVRPERRFRLVWRYTNKSVDGIGVIKIGVCCGYWPCLKAPYLQFSIGIRILDLWYGYESYRKTHL